LPVLWGAKRAAYIACFVMLAAQTAVVLIFFMHQNMTATAIITLLIALQVKPMAVLIKNPKERAPWFNGIGVGLYVLGMMISAFFLSHMA
jgi:hypothetical protein